jgi:hypothetical protein
MRKEINFGEHVEGYNIPVLNEREVRAAAGILFFDLIISLLLVILKEDFLMIKYFIILFLTDFIIRVFMNPKFSPTLILGRLIVSRQNPEYVGAVQKKFAWIIGLVLATTMFILMVVLNTYSPITGIICLICVVFLFFETSFGICLGCLFYKWFYKEKAQYCPGEICDVKAKQDIQKTSMVQILIVFGFIAYIVLAVFLYNNKISEKPKPLWNFGNSEQTK